MTLGPWSFLTGRLPLGVCTLPFVSAINFWDLTYRPHVYIHGWEGVALWLWDDVCMFCSSSDQDDRAKHVDAMPIMWERYDECNMKPPTVGHG